MSFEKDHPTPDTSSFLEISIPKDYCTLGDIEFEWQTTHYEQSTNPLTTLIKPKTQIWNKKNSSSYLCSPFDYATIVIGRALLIQSSQKFILEQICYGPIKIQAKLIDFYQQNHHKSKAIFYFGKNVEKQGEIKVLRAIENSDGNSVNSIKLLFRIQGIISTLKISKDSQLNDQEPLFKFYQDQVTSLGISFTNQLSDFKKLLSNLKISVQSGHYLKVLFPSRVARDYFIFQVLKQTGIVIKQLSIVPSSISKTRGTCIVEVKDTPNPQKRTQRIKDENQNELLDQSELLRETIIKDFEKILNSSICNMMRQEEPHTTQQFQLPMREPRKTIKNSKSVKNTCESPIQEKQKNAVNFVINKKQQKLNEQKISDSGKTQRNNQAECQILKFKKKNQPSILKKIASNQGKTKNIPKFEHIQSQNQTFEELYEKINRLVNVNEQLVNQNNKLKEENLKLKYNCLKQSKPEAFKVDQVKEMMEKMAKRLYILEQQQVKKKQRETRRTVNFLSKRNIGQNMEKNTSNTSKTLKSVKSAHKSFQRVRYPMKKSNIQKEEETQNGQKNNVEQNSNRLIKVRSNQSLYEAGRKQNQIPFPSINPYLINLGNVFSHQDKSSMHHPVRSPRIVENMEYGGIKLIKPPKREQNAKITPGINNNTPLLHSLNLASLTRYSEKNFFQFQKSDINKNQVKRSDFHKP